MEFWEAMKLLAEGKQVRQANWKQGIRLAQHNNRYLIIIRPDGDKEPFTGRLSDGFYLPAEWEEYKD